jgi:hypothetical protein
MDVYGRYIDSLDPKYTSKTHKWGRYFSILRSDFPWFYLKHLHIYEYSKYCLPSVLLLTETMTSAFFRSLDSSFIHFSDTNENPPLLYKSTDCYVQKFFELPIPVLGGSTVKYHFTTNGGDISFLTKFYSKGNSEVVFGPSRVPSDQEAYTGQYKSTKDGTLILCFDNNFSWFTPKYLTYHVEVFQPAFTAADNARCLRSRSMLKVCVEDTRNAEGSLSESRVKMKELNTVIPSMENRLNILKTELASKKAILQRAYDEAEEMAARIEANLDKKNGLCIRYVARGLSSLSSLSLSSYYYCYKDTIIMRPF